MRPPFQPARAHFKWGATCVSVLALAWATPSLAQSLSEAEAIERATNLPDRAVRDDALRAGAVAESEALPRYDNPTLEVGFDHVSGNIGRETESHIGVVQPIGINGARGRERDALTLEAGAVDFDIAWQRQLAVADVRIAYAECSAGYARVRVYDGQMARLGRIERKIALRERAGDASGYELRRVRLSRGSVEADLAMAQGARDAACARLGRLTGVAAPVPTDGPDMLLATVMPKGVTPTTQSYGPPRPDLAARQERLRADDARADAARRRQRPDLAVGLGYKRIDEPLGSAQGPTVSLSVTLPIFSKGSAATRAAEARRDASAADLALEQREQAAAVDAATHRRDGAARASNLAHDNAKSAERVVTIAEAGYGGGEMDITELVDAYDAAALAELQAIDLTEQAVKAGIDVHLLKGELP